MTALEKKAGITQEEKEREQKALKEILESCDQIEKDLEEPKPKKKESQVRAEKKYLEKFDELKIRVPAGKKEMIKERAEELGLSVNAYLQKLITDDLY